MSWIRICISPYGSGSDFYYTNPDPQIRIQIRVTSGQLIFYYSSFLVNSQLPGTLIVFPGQVLNSTLPVFPGQWSLHIRYYTPFLVNSQVPSTLIVFPGQALYLSFLVSGHCTLLHAFPGQ